MERRSRNTIIIIAVVFVVVVIIFLAGILEFAADRESICEDDHIGLGSV